MRKVLKKRVAAENSNMELDIIRNRTVFKERDYALCVWLSHFQYWSVERTFKNFDEATPLQSRIWGRDL